MAVRRRCRSRIFEPRRREDVWLGDCFKLAIMNTPRADADVVNFGELDPKTNELLQQGVVAYRTDREKADSLFKQALALAPQELAPYYCLYKIHTYMGSLDYAADVAAEGMKEATRQAGWPSDPTAWPAQAEAHDGPAAQGGRAWKGNRKLRRARTRLHHLLHME